MSKGVFGEKLWTANKRYKDINIIFTIIPAPFFVIALYTTYLNLFWETMFFASVPFFSLSKYPIAITPNYVI